MRTLRKPIITVILVMLLVSLACQTSTRQPTQPPTEKGRTEALKPTQVLSKTSAPVVTSAPTSTPSYRVALVDDGIPLAPQVIEQRPAGGQAISPNGTLSLTFDQPMDETSTGAALQVVDADGKSVSGQVSWPTTSSMEFKPDQPFTPGKVYLMTLGNEATSAAGVPIADPLEISFETVGALEVVQVFPANGSFDIESNMAVTVIFNRPVVPLVIVEELPDLPSPLTIEPAVAGHGEWLNTSVFIFHPDKPLPGSTTYTARVPAGLTDVTGAEGSRLAQDYVWEFTTIAPSMSGYGLRGGAWLPEDYYRNVLLDQGFGLYFNQPMDRASVEGNLSITSLQGEAVPLITEWNDDSTSVIFTPTVLMALGTNYTLVLNQQATDEYGSELSEGLEWHFTTVLPPAILATEPEDGTRQSSYSGRFSIYFASPMNLNTVVERVKFTPDLGDNKVWYYQDWSWRIDFYGLSASTDYSVEILPGMEDIYGNQITEGKQVSFRTGPFQPSISLQMPYGPALYRQNGPQDVFVRYTNVSSFDLKLYRVSPDQFVDLNNYTISPWRFKPSADDYLVNEWSIRPEGGQDVYELDHIVLKDAHGDTLPAGVYFLALESPEVKNYDSLYDDTRQLIVANANLTFKTTQTEVLLWMTDLDTGRPIGGAPATIYDSNFSEMTQGTTDDDGLMYVSGLTPPENYWESRYAIVDDGQYFALTDSGWGASVSSYDFGIWQDYYTPPKQTIAYMYTDRPLYRPGQPVHFKGIVRTNDDLAYSLPDSGKVEIRIESYEGEVYKENLLLSALGTFEGELTLSNDAALGYYTIYAYLPQKQEMSIGALGFSVAEYRKPEFLVEVTAEPTDVRNGDMFNVTISADYYSGGGVGDAEVYWTLTAESYYFPAPEKLFDYNFSDDDLDRGYYDYYDTPGSQIIAEGQGSTDVDGNLVLSLPASLSETGRGQRLTLEASVTDIAGTYVSGRASVVAHRGMVYPGVKSQTYVGQVGKEQGFEIVAVDWSGNLLPGQTVSVEIVERRWHSIQKMDEMGNITWETSVEDIPVEGYPVEVTLDAQAHAVVKFTPITGGVFRATVIAVDDRGNEGRTSAYMWVAGENYIPWRQSNDRSFQLVADRQSYTPGDEAELLIASPFQGEAYALVTIERGHIRQSEVVQLVTNSVIYRLPITADMAPNIYVSVIIVKGVDENNVRPDFRVSMAELKVDTRLQKLNVELSANPPISGPREQVVYTVKTTDDQGRPVSAEVSLSLADLAVLSLTSPNSQPILDYFYSKRSLGVQTSVSLIYSIEFYNAELAARETPAEGLGMGSGGGKGEGDFGVVEVRGNFPDTAFWKADVQTDANGEATVSITLPDNLTTWRMDARAVTEDTRVGESTLDLIATKPLLVRPQAPRFFVVGDEAQLGAAVHNNTDSDLTVDVSLQAEGLVIAGDAIQQVNIAAHQQAYVTWNITVNPDSQRVDLIFSAQGGEYSDASRPTLGTLDNQGIPVYRYEVPETVGTAGMIAGEETRIEAISLPQNFAVQEGNLAIKIQPSLAASMIDGLTWLEHYEYECTEQVVSKFLPNVLTTRALVNAGLSMPELEANLKEQVNVALQKLYNQQNADGGWGWWQLQQSHTSTTAYVVFGLVEARDAGYAVDDDTIQRGISFLKSKLKNVKSLKDTYMINQQAFLLFVLARAGEGDASKTVQLYEYRQSLSLYGRAYLAQALFWTVPGEESRLDTLKSDFVNAAIMSATGTHWEENYRDYWNWNTDTRSTAVILGALTTIDPQNALNPNVVRWLMSARNAGGYWASTQETAWTLIALTNWMVASGELQADYAYAVGFNGERIGEGEANSDNLRESYQLSVDITQMLVGEPNRLAIARDGGPGNLYYTAHMTLNLPVEEVDALDRGIVLSRSYYPVSDAGKFEAPVTQATQGDILYVRLTVVVPHALHFVVIDDPLPAGLEGLDQSLLTSPQAQAPDQYNWRDMWRHGWGWWYFDHVEMRDSKLVLSADYLPAGTYVYTYQVRASTPGTFRVIPPTGQEFYFPEVYGRGDGSLFVVVP